MRFFLINAVKSQCWQVRQFPISSMQQARYFFNLEDLLPPSSIELTAPIVSIFHYFVECQNLALPVSIPQYFSHQHFSQTL